jgi:DNA invertase Pin-like site-specific DNA recombinase
MNKRGRKTPAVEYLRVSGLSQVDGDGKDRQADSNKLYAERHGYKIEKSWFDGVSGCNDVDEREGLSELFEYIEEKNIQICILEGADRLGRDFLISETILARFRQLNCEVRESRSGQELTNSEDNPTKELVSKVLQIFSMFEKKLIVKKLAAARKRKREATGKCEGRKAYGEESAEEQKILTMARTLRRKPKNKKQKSYAAVAAALTALGHTNRRGGEWTSQSVRNILVS